MWINETFGLSVLKPITSVVGFTLISNELFQVNNYLKP